MEYVVGQQVAPGLVVVHEDTLKLLREQADAKNDLRAELSKSDLELRDMTEDRDAWIKKENAASNRLVEALLENQEMRHALEQYVNVFLPGGICPANDLLQPGGLCHRDKKKCDESHVISSFGDSICQKCGVRKVPDWSR